MKKEDFFEVLGKLDDDIVKGAKATVKKKMNRKAWGAVAACLCLVVGATVLLRENTTSGGISSAITGGGGMDKGNDRMTYGYSVAVYPATEHEENVDSAEVVNLMEREALDNLLAEHLPKQLPEGFHYGREEITVSLLEKMAPFTFILKIATLEFLLKQRNRQPFWTL